MRNFKFYLVLFFTVSAHFVVYGQVNQFTLKGFVNNELQQPIFSASLKLSNTNLAAVTNADGSFELAGIPAGKYTLTASAVGHRSWSREVTVENSMSIPTIVLSNSDHVIETVQVNGKYYQNYKMDSISGSLRLQSSILETPQNIQIVSGAMIKDQQLTSIADGLIRNVSGVTQTGHWGDLYANLKMRGSQIQSFRNGMNVVSSFWGPLTPELSMVDHVEFVKGPAGFMLSSGDPAGLYNIVTKKPTGNDHVDVSMMLGSFNLWRAAVDVDGRFKQNGKVWYRLNVAAQNRQSFRDYEFNDRYSIAPVISYQIDPKTTLTLEYALQKAKMSDVASFYVFSPEGYKSLPRESTTIALGTEPTVINDHSAFVNLQHAFDENWKLTAQVAYLNYNQVGANTWPSKVFADGKMIRGLGIWDAVSESGLGQVFVNGNFNTGKVRHKVLAGIDAGSKKYYADWAASFDIDSVGKEFNPKQPGGNPAYGYPVYDRSKNIEARAALGGGYIGQRYTAVYVQDEIGFWEERIRLTLAARYTSLSQAQWGDAAVSATKVTPRLGLSVSIDKSTAVYGMYDQAFIPQAGILFDGSKVKPITGNNLEFGLKRDWFDGKWNTSLAVYQITKNHEITSYGPSPKEMVEIGQKLFRGIEFDLKGELVRGLNVSANYAYTDAKISKVNEGVSAAIAQKGRRLAGADKHVTNVWLTYRVQDGAVKGLGVSAGFTGLIDRGSAIFSKDDPSRNLDDYYKFDGGISYEKGRFRTAVNINNIFDRYLLLHGGYYGKSASYDAPTYYWQTDPPRNFRLSVGYQF